MSSAVQKTKDKSRTPICVDLDGTLVKTDVLIESIFSIFSSIHGVSRLPKLFTLSRADFKQRVSKFVDLRADLLPFNTELITFLRQQKQSGHPIILVTAADRQMAEAVAKHLDLFDEIIASDGVRNLKGAVKSQELVRRFGSKGFDYVGNDRADLAVWREANGIVIVNASRAVLREARKLGNVLAEFSNQPPVLLPALRAMRPYQWVKNFLVFVPLLASRSFGDLFGLLGALCIFASFCLTASGIYLVNDLLDLTADRHHPNKRNRPFASGALPVSLGVWLAGLLIAIGIGLALIVNSVVFVVAYAAVSLSYSFLFKQYPLLDVFILAGLYTVRILAGGVASHHITTLWLLAFSGFTFLSLAFVKRAGELSNPKSPPSDRASARRGYSSEDRPVLLMFGIASAFASSVVLALFVSSTAAEQQYQSFEILWVLVPLVLFWQCRLWLSTARGNMHDDPILFAFRDWVSWMVFGGMVAIMILASGAFW